MGGGASDRKVKLVLASSMGDPDYNLAFQCLPGPALAGSDLLGMNHKRGNLSAPFKETNQYLQNLDNIILDEVVSCRIYGFQLIQCVSHDIHLHILYLLQMGFI